MCNNNTKWVKIVTCNRWCAHVWVECLIPVFICFLNFRMDSQPFMVSSRMGVEMLAYQNHLYNIVWTSHQGTSLRKNWKCKDRKCRCKMSTLHTEGRIRVVSECRAKHTEYPCPDEIRNMSVRASVRDAVVTQKKRPMHAISDALSDVPDADEVLVAETRWCAHAGVACGGWCVHGVVLVRCSAPCTCRIALVLSLIHI